MNWLNNELDRIGWSDSELARRCGVTPAAIYRITKEGKIPSAKLARAIAEALRPFTRISQAEVFRCAGLLDDKGDGAGGHIAPHTLAKFESTWEQLTPEERQAWEDLVDKMSAREFAELFMDYVRTRLSHLKSASADIEPGRDEQGRETLKDSSRKKTVLRRHGRSA